MPAPRTFALYPSGNDVIAVDDLGVRVQITGADYLTRRERLPQRVKRAIGFVLGWIGALLYFSPLFWLGSLLVSPPFDAYLLVAFVGLVVAFFAVLNLYVIASVVAWKKARHPRIELEPPHRRSAPGNSAALPAPGAQQAPLDAGSTVSVTGRVVSLGSRRASTVLVDLWLTGDQPLRLTEARPFAVVRDGQMPVVVTVGRPPDLHAAPEHPRLADAMMALGAQMRAFYTRLPITALGDDEPVERVVLRPGDEVRVTGTVMEVVDDVAHFVLDGREVGLTDDRDGTPYREGERQRGVVVGATLGSTIVIERL